MRDHDNGWREPDAAPTIDPATGAVRDFVGVPAAVKQEVWPRCLAGLADAPWAAALVAHHAISVYDRFRSDAGVGRRSSPGWRRHGRACWPRPAARWTRWSATTSTCGSAISASLAFCNAWSEPQVLGPWTIRLLDARHLLVEPNPFVLRRADRGRGAGAAAGARSPATTALHAAWRAAPVVTLTGVVVGRTRTS